MRFILGNKKLGPGVLHLSRPVGMTCPVSCAYHPLSPGQDKNKCYMVRLEGIHPNTRKAATRNLTSRWDKISNALFDHGEGLVRMHVGGDFLAPDGELDRQYILDWVAALDSLAVVPHILCFTHVRHAYIVDQFREYAPNFQLIASVHNVSDLRRAQACGFTRFSLAMEEKHYEWEKGIAWVERLGMKFLVCPEIRKKLPNCESCRYCWNTWEHGGHVAFPEHSQPDWPAIHARKKAEREGALHG